MDTLTKEIQELRERRNAIILAHYYQRPEVQDLADRVGDSLGLARAATEVEADVIVFCGVHFMAETAAILNPDTPVLLPDTKSGCPMADMITREALEERKADDPDAVVVTYVNSSAAVKASSDICCTSANAVRVVEDVPAERPVLFTPDRNLGHYVRRRTGRNIMLWEGWCPTHERILPEHILERKREHPDAAVVVHPECPPAVIDLADAVASTGGMLDYCAASECGAFIIGTESGFLYPLERRCPDKKFYAASPVADCPNMKRITAGKVRDALESMQPRVTVPDDIARDARAPIERMLAAGRDRP
ncbi:quinolinate synthase NadA [Kiritimatiella glycovorans]|uniref:Quinolinate synthase n=1 Tax=Kiritimatiella glycovorans TaxID=1307763 RepID=A0A0G3EEZ5_9BACT|nr:quinolinate synthase NadA [Kiritimatiella glycovorans]AKJ63325.1 Quinolinate synthase A [Kiritimatiella glycovorans]